MRPVQTTVERSSGPRRVKVGRPPISNAAVDSLGLARVLRNACEPLLVYALLERRREPVGLRAQPGQAIVFTRHRSRLEFGSFSQSPHHMMNAISTWPLALAGGVLIGLAATLLLWLNGRVAGVSGILNGVIFPRFADVSWRAAFLIGLIVAGGAYMALVPDAPLPRVDYSRAGLIVAGLLVGFGTRMGNGCTSGHGVCGIGRLSMRSLVAVLTFMATAIATTFLIRHVGS